MPLVNPVVMQLDATSHRKDGNGVPNQPGGVRFPQTEVPKLQLAIVGKQISDKSVSNTSITHCMPQDLYTEHLDLEFRTFESRSPKPARLCYKQMPSTSLWSELS